MELLFFSLPLRFGFLKLVCRNSFSGKEESYFINNSIYRFVTVAVPFFSFSLFSSPATLVQFVLIIAALYNASNVLERFCLSFCALKIFSMLI